MPTINRSFMRTVPKKARSTLESDRLALRKKVYAKERWKRMKYQYLSDHPLCEVCLVLGRYTPATHVHHMYSFTLCDNYDSAMRVAFDESNFCSICDKCHGVVHHEVGQTNGQTPEDMAEIVRNHQD